MAIMNDPAREDERNGRVDVQMSNLLVSGGGGGTINSQLLVQPSESTE